MVTLLQSARLGHPDWVAFERKSPVSLPLIAKPTRGTEMGIVSGRGLDSRNGSA